MVDLMTFSYSVTEKIGLPVTCSIVFLVFILINACIIDNSDSSLEGFDSRSWRNSIAAILPSKSAMHAKVMSGCKSKMPLHNCSNGILGDSKISLYSYMNHRYEIAKLFTRL